MKWVVEGTTDQSKLKTSTVLFYNDLLDISRWLMGLDGCKNCVSVVSTITRLRVIRPQLRISRERVLANSGLHEMSASSFKSSSYHALSLFRKLIVTVCLLSSSSSASEVILICFQLSISVHFLNIFHEKFWFFLMDFPRMSQNIHWLVCVGNIRHLSIVLDLFSDFSTN